MRIFPILAAAGILAGSMVTTAWSQKANVTTVDAALLPGTYIPRVERIIVTPASTDSAEYILAAAQELASRYKVLTSNRFSFGCKSLRKVQGVWNGVFRVRNPFGELTDRTASVTIGAHRGNLMLVRSTIPQSFARSESVLTERQAASKLNLPSAVLATLKPDRILFAASEQPKNAHGEGVPLYRENLVEAYRVVYYEGEHLWQVTIDASTAAVLEKKNIILFHGSKPVTRSASNGRITARIHHASPYDTLSAVGLPDLSIEVNGKLTTTDSLGYWSIPDVSAPFLLTGTLEGPFSLVTSADGALLSILGLQLPASGEFMWDATNSSAAARDAFYSVARIRRHMLGIDPMLIGLTEQMPVNVNLDQTCNAFYDPGAGSLNFFRAGDGCVNSAEIADVVYHEFGHRVNHVRYAMITGENMQDGSLNEGFADLFSSLLRDDPRIGIDFFEKRSILRTCENMRRWPRDISSDPHKSGEIISGAVWDMRKVLGLVKTEQLFNDACQLAPDGKGMFDPKSLIDAYMQVLLAILTVDDDDNDITNGTPNSSAILEAFSRHNIGFSSSVRIALVPFADQDTLAQSYETMLSASYESQLGTLDLASIRLNYSVNGAPYKSVTPLALGGGLFRATIGKLPAGSVVKYYASAASSLDPDHAGQSPDSSNPLVFLVGFHQRFLDAAEQNSAWQAGAAGDGAVTGKWVRAIPNGTIGASGYVQQDSDHSLNGTMCYVTGNASTDDIGFDDVDSGTTTLTTAPLDLRDLKNPVIRYWYYYSNDEGQNPSIAHWQTRISSDAGNTWRDLQNTLTSTAGWTQFGFRVRDYVLPGSDIRIQFLATDTIAAVVEAGVDDLEILEADADLAIVADPEHRHAPHAYPNPARTKLNVPVDLAAKDHLLIVLKDIRGAVAATLFDGPAEPGKLTLQFELPSLSSGTYWLQTRWSKGQQVEKVVVE